MKPHNILLDQRKKVVKICDFGISKLLTKTNAMTVSVYLKTLKTNDMPVSVYLKTLNQ